MSSIDLEDEDVERIPDLDLPQQKFLLTLPEYREDVEIKNGLLSIIRTRNMAPWYETIYREIGWDCDEELLTEMKTNNEESLRTLNEDIETAQTHSSGTEVRDAYLRKARYLSRIGDKDSAITALSQAFALTVALGYKLDNVFTCIRIGFFFMDHELIRRNLERAEDLATMGADYNRRNRLKVYQGFYGLAIRDFRITTCNFLQTVTTFSCYELMDFTNFIRYTVLLAIFTLPRKELREKVINCSDILEGLYRIPDVEKYVLSLYKCQYADFFTGLAEMEQIFRRDCLLHSHYRFYVREMKIKAYSQFLVSYRTLTFAYMAEQFGVTEEFLEKELSPLIAEGRLCGKIDKINGAIVVTRGSMESKNDLFGNVIKEGDVLLNRVHKLARIVDNCN